MSVAEIVKAIAEDLDWLEPGDVSGSARARSIFLSGSLAAGWSHASSDIDLYVVVDQMPDIQPTYCPAELSVDPPTVPVVILDREHGRYDVEYWLTRQVEQLLRRCTSGDRSHPGFNDAEVDFLYRLQIGVPISGSDWLATKQRELAASLFKQWLVHKRFDMADGLLEDALGMIASGDDSSAVLAAQQAFTEVIDGVLAHYGELAPGSKWRAQKFRRARPAEIGWDEYWSRQTMSGCAMQSQSTWVAELVDRCRALMLELDT